MGPSCFCRMGRGGNEANKSPFCPSFSLPTITSNGKGDHCRKPGPGMVVVQGNTVLSITQFSKGLFRTQSSTWYRKNTPKAALAAGEFPLTTAGIPRQFYNMKGNKWKVTGLSHQPSNFPVKCLENVWVWCLQHWMTKKGYKKSKPYEIWMKTPNIRSADHFTWN